VRRELQTMMQGKSHLVPAVATVLLLGASEVTLAQSTARDPGVRSEATVAGEPITGLSASEQAFFQVGQEEFRGVEGVGDGLGPRFNLDSCAGCHVQPAVGGTSPAVNPQVAVATAFGASNQLPSFITLHGPVREVRY